jgi:hypothetical protein
MACPLDSSPILLRRFGDIDHQIAIVGAPEQIEECGRQGVEAFADVAVGEKTCAIPVGSLDRPG